MGKNIKKFIAVLSAIAMLISSVTVYPNREVKADDIVKWENVTFLTDGAPETSPLYTNQFKFYCETDSQKTAVQIELKAGSKVIYTPAFGSGAITSLDNSEYFTDGDQLRIKVSVFLEAKITKFIIYDSAKNPYTCYVYNEQGTEGTISDRTAGGGEPSDPEPAETNLATGKHAVASSRATGRENTPDEFSADKAVDGKVETRWAAKGGDKGTDVNQFGEYIYIDLGARYDITKITTNWENIPSAEDTSLTGTRNGYRIYYAKEIAGDNTNIGKVDTSVWNLAHSAMMPEQNKEQEITQFSDAKVTAQYIMIYCVGKASNTWGVSINEIGVYGTPAEETPVGSLAAPSSAVMYNLTDAGEDFTAVIEDAKNSYEEGVIPTYELLVNNRTVKEYKPENAPTAGTKMEIRVSAEEMKKAPLNDGNNNIFTVKVSTGSEGEDYKESEESARTAFYYNSANVAEKAVQHDVPKIFVSTSRTSKSATANLFTDTQKTSVEAGIVVEKQDRSTGVEAFDYGTIKIRGNSTAQADKKAYNISFHQKKNLFGLSDCANKDYVEGSKKWSLLANIFDKTLLRNQIAMDFQRNMEENRNEDTAFTSKCMTVDLYIDGKYLGAYTLIESVETGVDRVNIDTDFVDDNDDALTEKRPHETAAAGVSVYDMLLELANDVKEQGDNRYDESCYYFSSTTYGEYLAINYPERSSTTYSHKVGGNQPAWVSSAKQFIDSFETTLAKTEGTAEDRLTEIEKYIDVNSFIDFYITAEYFKIKDIDFSSTRFYIKDGKLYAGPLWDLDLSSGNTNDGSATSADFWAQRMLWFKQLMANEAFKNKVIERYKERQTEIQKLYESGGTVDQEVERLRKAIDANYKEAYVAQTPDSPGWKLDKNYGDYNSKTLYKDYDSYIAEYKLWLSERNRWLASKWLYKFDINDETQTAEEKFPSRKTPLESGNETWYDYTDYNGVQASDAHNTGTAKQAIDNDNKTSWNTDSSDEHHLIIDLGKERTIKEIAIDWETANAADYDIEFAGSNGEYQVKAPVVGRYQSRQHKLDRITFTESETAQYVKITLLKRATEWGNRIWEIAIYGPDTQFDDELKTDNTIVAGKDVLSVEGFQIQTNGVLGVNGSEEIDNSVNFRTVCKASNIGSKIEVNNKNYTVQSYGTVYAMDWSNGTGNHEYDAIQTAHTLIDITGGPKTSDVNKVPHYEGRNTLGGRQMTCGYEATAIGRIDGWDTTDAEHTYYSRTITGLDEWIANTIYVRAFIIATDDSGEQTVIYSEKTAVISIAEIADKLYANNMSKNDMAHEYLYQKILNNPLLKEKENKYYRTQKIEFGWDDSLYTPGKPTLVEGAAE